MITQEQIQQVKDKIVKEFDPEKIVLFGSYAYGEPNESSDLDLLIVKESDQTTHQLSIAVRRLLKPFMFEKDIVVYKPKEVDEWKSASASFISQVLKKGKLLYER